MSLSKRYKIVLAAIVIALLGCYSAFKYVYKPHKTIDEFDVKFSGTSEMFIEKVKADATIWQNVIVELSGVITSKDQRGITLNDNIYCQLEKGTLMTSLHEGENISIKGRMIGYDDLLEEIKLDQTIIK